MSENDELDELSTNTNRNMIATAITAGVKIADVKVVPREDKREETSVLVPKGFSIETVSNNLDRPLRKTGVRSFDSAKSFCSYVNKHKSEDETIIVAHEDSGKIKAILNDNGEEKPSWSDFSALLELGFSKQFLIWYGSKEKGFSQEGFAEFIEDNRVDMMVGELEIDGKQFKNISSLELKSLILNLKMTSEQKFSSQLNPVTGETSLSYTDEIKGKGDLVVPEKFILAIPIYKSGDLFRVIIRLKMRVRDGVATFSYFIDQIEQLKEKAFDMICQRITDGNLGSEENESKQFLGTGIEVLKGSL